MNIYKDEPERFLALLHDTEQVDAPNLSFLLEFVGTIPDRALALRTLLQFKDHPKPYVREGVLLGLDLRLGLDMIEELNHFATHDPSETIRNFARGMLSDLTRELMVDEYPWRW